MTSQPTSAPQTLEPRTTAVPAHCDKHGAYQAKQVELGFGAKPVVTGCPKCSEEDRVRRIAENAQRDLRDKTERVAALLGRSCVPPRFRDKSLTDYRANEPAQVRALTIAQRYVESFSEEPGASLILCGRPGTGKTHIACGIAQALTTQFKQPLFSTVLAAIRHIRDTYRKDSGHSESEAIDDFIAPDLLILDEVGVQVGSEHEKMLLFEIINERYQRCRATILISNLTQQELGEYLGERVMDRFRETGAVVAFGWGSFRGMRDPHA